MIKSGVINLVTLLFVHTSAYNDYLTHTALDQVPAQLGEAVEIRCTKIIEKSEYDYIQSAECSGYRGESCKHVWSKDGQVLNPGYKYRMKSSITFDYCETFEWTTDIVRNMHIPAADGYERYRDRDMKCFASALTITNVTVSDLGEYQCKLTSGYGGSSSSSSSKYDNVQKITLYNKATPKKLPAKIEYFENFYTKGIRSKLLMQCVVSGGPVHWFIRFDSKDCNRWDDSGYNRWNNNCVNETMKPISTVSTMDAWRCFNYTTSSHQPYNMDQVTESFIYIENICSLDWAGVYCSADSEAKVRSAVGELVIKDDYGSYYSYWRSEEVMAALGYVMLPIVVPIFFIVAGILACVRGKVSNCCGGSNYGYSSVSPIPQTYSYVVAPAPQGHSNRGMQVLVPPQQAQSPHV